MRVVFKSGVIGWVQPAAAGRVVLHRPRKCEGNNA
jgi:hypothetical protein